MRPVEWRPAIEPSAGEEAIIRRLRRAKLFVFQRRWRHEVFSDGFQAELAGLYADRAEGQPPIPPAQLALATIRHAYTGVSDDEVIEATTMDRRWQLVLDCLDGERPPFSKGTLVNVRRRLIAQDLDRGLIERTVEVAARTGEGGARPLRGAGRVEDTYNLMGHALAKAVGVIGRQQGRGLADIAAEAGAAILGGPSLKAALDCDWDEPGARAAALGQVLAALAAVEAWLGEQPAAEVPAAATAALATAREVRAQDVETKADGTVGLRRGVAPERRISVEDEQMRHGRKSTSQRVDGYKRHVLRDRDSGLVRAVGVTAANVPEARVTDELRADLARQPVELRELHIDRAYLSSTLVRDRGPGLAVYCKAWRVHNGERFPKTAFALDWDRGTIRCPNAVVLPFSPGGVVRFPAEQCAACPLRARCTPSAHGRSVAIHPDERLLSELRQRQLTPAGRAKLRERVAVEHALAHVGRWHGDRARYVGQRKNLFDLRRCAVVHNLHVLARSPAFADAA